MPSLLSIFAVFKEPPDPMLASYYPNITGFIHGDTAFYNLSPHNLEHFSHHHPDSRWSIPARKIMRHVNVTEMAERSKTWGWAAANKVTMSVVERKSVLANGRTGPEDVAFIHVRPIVWRDVLHCLINVGHRVGSNSRMTKRMTTFGLNSTPCILLKMGQFMDLPGLVGAYFLGGCIDNT